MKKELNENDDEEWTDISVSVPPVFLKLAKYYVQDPEYLAHLLVTDFCRNPPESLTIVSRDEPDSPPAYPGRQNLGA
jgi:hypothetical protein